MEERVRSSPQAAGAHLEILLQREGKKEKQKSEQRVQRLCVRRVMDEAAMRTEDGKGH